jgi:MFS family permease
LTCKIVVSNWPFHINAKSIGTVAGFRENLAGTPIGAPIVGWVADTFGPRRALGVGAASGFAAAIVVVIYLAKYCDLRLRVDSGRLSLRMNSGAAIN